MAGNRTRINCLEGNYADHYTTIAHASVPPNKNLQQDFDPTGLRLDCWL
jgi:hypothetical protein